MITTEFAGVPLAPRNDPSAVQKQIQQLQDHLNILKEGYDHGLMAEKQSRVDAVVKFEQEINRLKDTCTGRKIDLEAILIQKRRNEQGIVPAWALVDPRCRIGSSNGGVSFTSPGRYYYCVGGDKKCVYIYVNSTISEGMVPAGIPPLPLKVRDIFRDEEITNRARLLAVLYQPEEWIALKPDPAVVVQWNTSPDYFVLAIWGGDKAEIEEFYL